MIKRNYNQSEWEFERSRLDPTRFWWLVNGADRRDFHGQVRVQDWMLTASLQRNNVIAIVPQEFWDVLSVNSETRTGFRWHLDLQTPRKLCVSTTGLLSLEGSLGHESQLLLSLHLLSNSVVEPPSLVFCWMKRMYMCENNPPDSWLICPWSIIIHHMIKQDDPLFVSFCGLNAHLNHIFTLPNNNFAQEKLSPSTLTLTNSVWASAPGVGYCKIYQNFAVGHRMK